MTIYDVYIKNQSEEPILYDVYLKKIPYLDIYLKENSDYMDVFLDDTDGYMNVLLRNHDYNMSCTVENLEQSGSIFLNSSYMYISTTSFDIDVSYGSGYRLRLISDMTSTIEAYSASTISALFYILSEEE